MAYVAVKGGERAIDNAHAWLDGERRSAKIQIFVKAED